jgi:hypothetical protein
MPRGQNAINCLWGALKINILSLEIEYGTAFDPEG